jgi:DNA-binding NarL/FixJ family response regulator
VIFFENYFAGKNKTVTFALPEKADYFIIIEKTYTYSTMIQIILVDDHELFRTGVRMFIESKHHDMNVVAEAESGEELFLLPQLTTAHIVLLDILLPGMNGIAVAEKLKKEYPHLKILAISAENSADVIEAMLNKGVDGFISKRKGGSAVLVEAIQSIMNGYEYFGKDISEIIYRIYLTKKHAAKVSATFTPQEHNIIELCSLGIPAKQIADRLGITGRTVEHHKQNIFEKLDIHSTVEMVQYAVKHGIIRIEH